MHEETKLEEMSDAVGFGLLASDIVLATEALVSRVVIDESDREVLRIAQAFLEGIGQAGDEVPFRDSFGQLGSMSAIDALEAIEHEAGHDVNEFAVPLAVELGEVLDGADPDQHDEALHKIISVFEAIGKRELIRVSSLSQPSSGAPQWLTPPETSLI